jgi:hypothetical protein
VRLASFNVENLFARAKVLNLLTWNEAEPMLAAFTRFNRLSQKPDYTKADKAAMVADLVILRVAIVSTKSGLTILNLTATARGLCYVKTGATSSLTATTPVSRSSLRGATVGSAGSTS